MTNRYYSMTSVKIKIFFALIIRNGDAPGRYRGNFVKGINIKNFHLTDLLKIKN